MREQREIEDWIEAELDELFEVIAEDDRLPVLDEPAAEIEEHDAKLRAKLDALRRDIERLKLLLNIQGAPTASATPRSSASKCLLGTVANDRPLTLPRQTSLHSTHCSGRGPASGEQDVPISSILELV